MFEAASCAPSRRGGSYIYALAPIASTGIAAITSADELLLLDRQTLQAESAVHFADVPAGVTCMVLPELEGTSIICAGRDGVIAIFDMRSQKRIVHFRQSEGYLEYWV